MLSYCLKCKKNTESINPKFLKTTNGRTMVLSQCAICGSKKSKFIKEQQAKGLLSNLAFRTPLNKIPLLGVIFFNAFLLDAISLYKMNNIIKFLLAGDKFMPEMHLRQPQFTYSACGPFTKHKQRTQKFKETGDTNYIYKNELDKACFADDSACSDSKDLIKGTVADKSLKNKAFDIAKDPKYDGYQRGLAFMVFKFFDKKSKGSGAKHVNTKLTSQNEQLADELHKPIIRKFKKRKVYSAFKDNIWAADLADMQLLSRCNKGIRFLLCVIDIFSKYAWVVPLKDKKV